MIAINKKWSLSTKIGLSIFIILSFVLLIVSSIYIYSNNQYMSNELEKDLQRMLDGVNRFIRDYETNAMSFSSTLSLNPNIISGVKDKDFNLLKESTVPILKNSDFDYIVITDKDGNVLIRAHEPEKIPAKDDNILNQINIQKALTGTGFVGIEEGKVVKMSIRAGSPILDENNNIIGAISTGYVISNNKIVDRAKEIFDCNTSIFHMDALVGSTFKEGLNIDKESLIKVLNSQENINIMHKVGETEYTSGMHRILGANGKPIGLVSISIPMDNIKGLKKTTIYIVSLSFILSLLLITIFVKLLSKKLVGLMKDLKDNMYEVGKGNFTVQCHVKSVDEIGDLYSSFNVMVVNQMELVDDIKTTIENLVSTSEEQIAISDQVTQAGEEVASSMEMLSQEAQGVNNMVIKASSLVDKLFANLNSTIQIANITKNNSSKTLDVAIEGKKTIEEVLVSMNEIYTKSSNMENLIDDFTTYLRKINIISDTINGLAEQTNLLALNASIEAARVGDVGRGFAVVADEIKKLAEQSDREAQEVGSLVEQIEEIANILVKASNENKEEVEKGTKLAKENIINFESIMEEMRQVEKDIESIVSANINEMEIGNDMVNLMKEIGESIEITTAHVEESAASVEQIAISMESSHQANQHTVSIIEELDSKIAGFEVIDRENLTTIQILEKAKTDHLMWSIKVSYMIEGKETIDMKELTSDRNCRLGLWYFDDNNPLKEHKEYKELAKPHRKVHECALKAVNAYKAGDIKVAKKALENLKYHSDKVIKLINHLIKIVE